MSDSPADIWSPDIGLPFPSTASCSCCHDDSHAALLDVLKSVEWGSRRKMVDGRILPACPMCGRVRIDGHLPDCALGTALRAATP